MGMRHFDVQLMGGIALHEGDIAEMKTGEGKTLVATLPLYLNAIPGNNVHLVTVNDYLAKRDMEWMSPVYNALGLRAAYIRNMMPPNERKEAYAADITYGTNSEFGFDYLRDNMATSLEGTSQRGHTFAIVDEVDSILIDEARTPLIISGEPETAAKTYYDFARIAKTLEGVPVLIGAQGEEAYGDADYTYDEKFKNVSPLQGAIDKVEAALGIENLYDPHSAQLVNHLIQALKAESLYHRDDEYVVMDGEVKIVDEFTGRIMEGRRWSDGLHQAVEAKERVPIKEEHITLATITLQNYFRLYQKLAGMTGTAKTEEKEFKEIYDLTVDRDPHERADGARRQARLHLQAQAGQVRGGPERHQGAPRDRPAGARRDDLRRGLRASRAAHDAPGHPARGPEREEPRARGRDHHGRRPSGRGHDRDEHGRPRRRHQARRGRARGRRPLRRRHGAPRGAPHRQPAPRPLRPPGRPRRDALLPVRRGRARAPVRRRPDLPDHRQVRAPRRRADGVGDALEADRGRAEEGRGAELRLAQERPQVRRRHEHPADGHLRAAPARARGRGSLRGDQGLGGRGRRGDRLLRTPRAITRRTGISRACSAR